MFCEKCGAPIERGTKFCPRCGAPVPTPAPAPSQNEGPVARDASHPRRRLAPPLIAALVVLALATASSAAYLVYALVIDPLPTASEQPATVDPEAEGVEKDDAEDDAATESEPAAPVETPAVEPEPAPVEETTAPEPTPEPAVAHDFECDAFYVDVPDDWVRSDANPGENDPFFWTVTDNGDGTYFFHCSNYWSAANDTVYVGVSAPSYCEYYGTTSDGRDVYGGVEAGGSFFTDDPSSGPVLTLK